MKWEKEKKNKDERGEHYVCRFGDFNQQRGVQVVFNNKHQDVKGLVKPKAKGYIHKCVKLFNSERRLK